jgi:hypothetical protein
MIILAELISLIEDGYQTDKCLEHNSYGLGFTALIKIKKIDGENVTNTVAEVGVGADYWILKESLVSAKGDKRRQALFASLISPIFKFPDGSSNSIDLCTTPERSQVRIQCKGYKEKYNKRGQRMFSRRGEHFIKIQQPLFEVAWVSSELASAPEPEELEVAV